MRRKLKIATAAMGLFLLLVVLLFPTEQILRSLSTAVTRPGGPTFIFRSARLRPWGLTIEGPTVQNPDGTEMVAIDWVRLRPSWLGFLHDGTGRPWRIGLAGCRGTADIDLAGEGAGRIFALEAKSIDLGSCDSLTRVLPGLAGIIEAIGHLSIPGKGDPTGEGTIQLRQVVLPIKNPGNLDIEALHVDTGYARWDMGNRRLTVSKIDLHGPDVIVSGTGTATIAPQAAHSNLNIRLTVVPGPAASTMLRRFIEQLPLVDDDEPNPDPDAPRLLIIRGTPERPQVIR